MQSRKVYPSNGRNEEKKRTASASEITLHPSLAVIGVLLGALTSVFTGRLLSIGSADIQGALGVSSDYMTWVQTAYNAENMFIGPLTVFMGARLGVRRVLMWASALFILAEFLTPFAGHNLFAFVGLQAVAGLAAGTYYPLTFTIIIRNFPLKYIYFGVGIYALDILASTHIAHLVESFYVTNLSWRWIFWNALLTAPLMMLSVYFGIPRQAMPARNPKLDFAGFLYAACSMTLIYIGLDQGERLDWLHSPLIAAFFATGLFLLVVSLLIRCFKPNPMLNLSFLRSRDFLLLGVVLVSFRFVIFASTLLVPNYLQVLHGYRPEQTAAVLSWVALPELLFAPLAGLLLFKVDSRLVLAIGFGLIGAGCFADSWLDPGWTGETFFVSQVVIAFGLAMALTGIIASLLRAALKVGALKNPVNILTLSCWFQTCRLFGAEIGKSLMTHFLKAQGDLHYAILSAHINGDWLTTERLGILAAQSSAAGAGSNEAISSAVGVLSTSLKHQISLLSFSDGFMLIALVSVATMIATGFISYSPPLVPDGK